MAFDVDKSITLSEQMNNNSRQHYARVNRKSWNTRFLDRMLMGIAFYLQLNLFGSEKKEAEGLLHKIYRFTFSSIIIMISFKILSISWYQLVYDSHFFEYKKLTGSGNLAESGGESGRINALQLMIEQDIRKLKLIGAPHMRIHVLACGFYMILLVLSTAYFQTIIYTLYVKPLDYSFMRMLLGEEEEQIRLNRLIAAQVGKLIQFSSNNLPIKYDDCLQRASFYIAGATNFSRQPLDDGLTEYGKSLSDHLEMIGLLRQMALSGQLQPFNRSANWLNKLASRMQLMLIVYELYAFALFAVIFYLPEANFPGFTDSWTSQDLLVFVEVLLICVNITNVSTFTQTLGFISAMDQIHGIIELIKTIEHCIHLNKMRFALIKSYETRGERLPNTTSGGTVDHIGILVNNSRFLNYKKRQCDECSNQVLARRLRTLMNADLLYIISHYKILIDQLKPLKPQHGFIAGLCLQYCSFVPLLNLMATPYLENSTWVPILLIAGALVQGWSNTCFLPLCYIPCRGRQLYNSLASLMAHLVEFGSHEIYYSRIAAVLSRELRDPQYLIDRFAARYFGIQFTYTTLMKIHFWSGLIYTYVYYATKSDTSSNFSSNNHQGSWKESFRFFL